MKRKKPTVKQIGEFTIGIYEKMRHLEKIVIMNTKAFEHYLRMNGEVDKFNEYLNTRREQYHSLFLTNYRESNDISRKRISFR